MVELMNINKPLHFQIASDAYAFAQASSNTVKHLHFANFAK